MARRGRFGRLPTAAQDLTSTIVSIAREMRNQQDNNIMSAWQKGGLFQGKPATDAVVLAYWKTRMAGVDKGDPLYDTYSQEVAQLEYSIAESKQTVLHAQGKLSDTGLANFYLGWAKKINPNTEFYRVLQRDASQFIQSAKTRNASAAAAAVHAAYVKTQNALLDRTGKSADYLNGVLNNIAVAKGLINPGQTLTGNFDTSDPGALAAILTALNGTGQGIPARFGENASKGASNDTLLYQTDASGNFSAGGAGAVNVTLGTVKAWMAKNEPGWNGQISVNDLMALNTRKEAGYQTALKAALKQGDATLAGKLTTAIGNLTEANRRLGIFPVEQAWKSINDAADKQFNAQPPPTPDQVKAIQATLDKGLSGLLSTPNLDLNTKARIQGQIDGNPNMSTLGEDWAGAGPESAPAGGAATAGSNAESARRLKLAQTAIDQVATGQFVYTSGTLDPTTGKFSASPTGTEIGAVDKSTLPGGQPAMVSQGPGLPELPVYVNLQPVTVTAYDVHGFKISTGGVNDATIGAVAYLQGKPMFQITLADGSKVWQASPPGQGVNGLTLTTDSSGAVNIRVDLPNVDTTNQTGQSDSTIGLTVTGPKTAAGTASYAINGQALLAGVDAPLFNAGVNSKTQNSSITIANLLATPDGIQTIQNLAKDPTWVSHISAEVAQYTGGDPKATAAFQSIFQGIIQNGNTTPAFPHEQRIPNADGSGVLVIPGYGGYNGPTIGPDNGTSTPSQAGGRDGGRAYNLGGAGSQAGPIGFGPLVNARGTDGHYNVTTGGLAPDDRTQIKVGTGLTVPAVPMDHFQQDHVTGGATAVTTPPPAGGAVQNPGTGGGASTAAPPAAAAPPPQNIRAV